MPTATTPSPQIRRRFALRSIAALVALLTATTATLFSDADAAPAPSSNGRAAAIAQSYKVNPTAAALSIGVTFGISLADYANKVAHAEARGIDLGIIGTIMAGEGCDGGDPTLAKEDQPEPLRAESSDPKAANGFTETEKYVPAITKYARANSSPESEARTESVPLGQAGALLITGAKSSAVTHVLPGGIREAHATADISGLDIAGVVQIAGLHWQAVHHSGGDSAVVGSFTVGALRIAGAPAPIPGGDPAAAFAAANTALAPLGIELRPPTARVVNGILFVDPLTLAVVPSATRDMLAGTLLGTAQPVRQSLVDAILALDCGNDTYVTVADIILGSITGSGSFSVELGGVQASTGELKGTSDLGDFADGLSLEGGRPDFEVLPEDAGQQPILEPAPTTATTVTTRGREIAAPISERTPGGRGGKLALVAALALGLIALLTEGDRRLMRRAQRRAEHRPITI